MKLSKILQYFSRPTYKRSPEFQRAIAAMANQVVMASFNTERSIYASLKQLLAKSYATIELWVDTQRGTQESTLLQEKTHKLIEEVKIVVVRVPVKYRRCLSNNINQLASVLPLLKEDTQIKHCSDGKSCVEIMQKIDETVVPIRHVLDLWESDLIRKEEKFESGKWASKKASNLQETKVEYKYPGLARISRV